MVQDYDFERPRHHFTSFICWYGRGPNIVQTIPIQPKISATAAMMAAERAAEAKEQRRR
jgi:hypothetical protein